MTDPAALLNQYRPVVQYDSLEPYYADSAAVITDHPGNVLKRLDGTVLAKPPELSLGFLRPDTYPTGETVIPTDYIDENDADYKGSAKEMHAKDGYHDKVHGRVVVENGVTWLQYWFVMYYDDPGLLNLGSHEGDIEMIQIRLDGDAPAEVSYAQHRSGVRAAWSDVELQNGAPVVYSARGTHASMLRSGSLSSNRSFLTDHNDAGGPRLQLELVTLSLTETPWAFWPGQWGGTRPPDQLLGQIGVEARSPGGFAQHGAWQDPALFHSQCDPDPVPAAGERQTVEPPAPPQPKLTVEPGNGVVKVAYAIAPDAKSAWATKLVVGVAGSDGNVPPTTVTVPHPQASGVVELSVPQGAGPVEVRATTHSDDGAVSATATAPVPSGG